MTNNRNCDTINEVEIDYLITLFATRKDDISKRIIDGQIPGEVDKIDLHEMSGAVKELTYTIAILQSFKGK